MDLPVKVFFAGGFHTAEGPGQQYEKSIHCTNAASAAATAPPTAVHRENFLVVCVSRHRGNVQKLRMKWIRQSKKKGRETFLVTELFRRTYYYNH